jgi:hypothetical protein
MTLQKSLFLILILLFGIACNKVVINSPATKLQVQAPSMLTGHCSPWTVSLLNNADSGTRAKGSMLISLAVTSSGAVVQGAEVYSDSTCLTPVTQKAISAGTSSFTVYVKYNIMAPVELTASAAGLSSASASTFNLMDFTRVDRLAGSIETGGYYEGIGNQARLSSPNGMATDGTYLYLTLFNYEAIVRIHIATKTVTHLAGIFGYALSGYADGIGSAARFKSPEGLTVLGNYLYVADYQNFVIRKIDLTTREVTTVAGTPGVAGATDGIGSGATFGGPVGMANDGTYIYISDYAKHTIRRLDPATNTVTTIAGTAGASGNVDDVGAAARLKNPFFLSTDGTYLYFPDSGSHTIRRLEISTNTVVTLAGSNGVAGNSDGNGAAASFHTPTSAYYHGGHLYIADGINHSIRRLDLANNDVITLSGDLLDPVLFLDGSFATARYNNPRDLAVVGNTLYVNDFYTANVRALDLLNQTTSTLAGADFVGEWMTVDGVGTNARFSFIEHLASDGEYIYIPDCGTTVRRMHIATRVVETIAGQDGVGTQIDGVGTAATFSCPWGIEVGGGNLYVADRSVIRKIDLSTMNVTTLAGLAGAYGATDDVGALARFEDNIEKMTLVGNDLFVFDYMGNTIRKVDVTNGTVTTVAGQHGVVGTADGIGTAATFSGPEAGAVIGNDLYILDYRAHMIRKMDLTTYNVTTFVGQANTPGNVDGIGTDARLNYPYSMTTDGTYLYVSDNNNHSIRKINPINAEVTTLVGVQYRGKDQEHELSGATTAFPSGIVWTPSGLFFSNDGINISWLH